MDDLKRLSKLIQERNRVAAAITAVINRPALIGHVGEYIAAAVFDIELAESASEKGIDGIFSQGGVVNGRSVNIKWHARQERILNITPKTLPDYYLVLAGPPGTAGSSRGDARLWLIESVYLFAAEELVAALARRGVKIGTATSVAKQFWQAAEIYPNPYNSIFMLTEQQKEILSHFGHESNAHDF